MTGARWRSAFVAALFALHPLHVESVAWIAERKDVLSTLFWLLTLGAWLAYLRSKKAVPYALALILYALGLMAKPMLVTLPFTLLLLDFWPLKRLALPLRGRVGEIRGLLREKAPLFAMAAASCVVTLIAQHETVQTLVRFPLAERIANAPQAYMFYLGKTFWPSSLAIFYPHAHTGLIAWIAVAAFLSLAYITALAFWLREKAPFLAFGWLWYLGTLVPVIGLVQVGVQAMADRYTYMPLVGIFVALSWGLAELGGNRKPMRIGIPAAAAAALLALSFITRAQVGYWADSRTLLEHALAVTSDNSLAHNNLGTVLHQQGRTREAITHYMEALRIQPDAVNPLLNLGTMYLQMDRIPEAINYSARAVEVDPDSENARLCLARALDRAGRNSEALQQIRRALRIKPDSIPALIGMGTVLGKMNRNAEAVEFLKEALKLTPDSSQVRADLGMALDREGRTREAEEQFREALRINPNDAESFANLQRVREILRRRPARPPLE
jgi:tetratricopeptide (TPR) repeat protein